MKILAHILEMAANEIKQKIPPQIFKEVKQKDPTPVFRAYAVGHEGVSTGKIVGIGNLVKKWFGSAVIKLVEKLWYGLKVFYTHGLTNDHEGRAQIGEVVHAFTEKIKDKLTAIAITYIYPEYRNLPLDVASIEADIEIDPDEEDGIHAVDVKSVTAIALGNSNINKPGFANATLLGELQAFANQSINGGGTMSLSPEEIKKAIQDGKLAPSDIFEGEDLVSDPFIKDYVKRRVSGEFAHRKRTDDKFDESRADWEKKEKELEKENEDLKRELKKQTTVNLKITAKEKFKEIAEQRKLDENQTNFIEKDIDKFEPENEEDLLKDLNLFVDARLDDYDDTLKALGMKKEEDDKDDKPGVGADNKTQVETEEDLVDPEKNDFIPG